MKFKNVQKMFRNLLRRKKVTLTSGVEGDLKKFDLTPLRRLPTYLAGLFFIATPY